MDTLLLEAISHAANVKIAFSNGWRYGSPIGKGNISIWDLYNMVPMDPNIYLVDLTGKEIIDMLEENFERTFSCDPMALMGGYCKRHLGLQVKFHIENPFGYRIEEILHEGERLEKQNLYKVAYITEQGVANKYGRNRQNIEISTVQALINYLDEKKVIQ